MSDTQSTHPLEVEMTPTEIRGWVEFSAWCALVMTPIIWWLQGPSVSTDQFVVRTGLLVISGVVAVAMRTWTILRPRLPGEMAVPQGEQPNTTDQALPMEPKH
ncbi:hypothetical protein [Schlesneria paludicola]|uniref:hypothetical protein n=1 Tax=Schlesneria paludicola TaxID=360056 RepID=UPI000299F5EB|nr:hypothetical protein [Schlesneria paludicola]